MHRQHPYAGYTPQAGGRGVDSPPGPGPDRTRQAMSTRGYPASRARGMGRGGGGPSAYNGYESPYPGPALDNPYGEEGFNHYRENGDEYNQFENASDPRRGGRPPHRRDHEDKVHDPLIEERLQRERPCRTLFIRNIKYETDSNEFRLKFEEFGEIKTFFDLISHRGMVFCTYYDMRAAERAKERLQGTELAGRPIDVHYSLPRDDQKNELNQGIITVTLIDSPTRAAIDDTELRRKLTTFGDVKSIQSNGNRPDSRTVEFYDLRSADEAHGKLRHQSLQDGIIETDFLFMGDQLPPPGPAMQERARDRPGAPRGGRGRGGRGRGAARGGYDDRRGRDWEDEYYSRDNRRASPPRSYEERWRERSPPPRGRMGSESNADREKMEQAKKVQDLLAALKGTGGASAPSPQPPSAYYPTSQPPPAAAAPFGFPPNLAHIGALLQQALTPAQAQQAAATLQQYHANAPPSQPVYSNMPPQSYPPMPPPSAMFSGGQQQQPPSGPYSYQPSSQSNQPQAAGGYSAADLYALIERQKQVNQGPPANALPPDSARYHYSPSSAQQNNSPPPAGGSSGPSHSIQDIMALLGKQRPS